MSVDKVNQKRKIIFLLVRFYQNAPWPSRLGDSSPLELAGTRPRPSLSVQPAAWRRLQSGCVGRHLRLLPPLSRKNQNLSCEQREEDQRSIKHLIKNIFEV